MSNRTFAQGIVACLAIMVAFGGALFLLNHGHQRPEGAAEHWLAALSDTTRKGVEEDATKRASKIGAPELARPVVWQNAAQIDRKSAFDDLEVGKAVVTESDEARVGFRVHARRANDVTKAISGVITLTRTDDEWTVTALDVGDPVKAGVPQLPSEGGPPPSSAPWSLWIGALAGSLVLGVIATALVRAAGATSPSPAAA